MLPVYVNEIHHNFPFLGLNGTRVTHFATDTPRLSLKELLQMLPPRDLSMYDGLRQMTVHTFRHGHAPSKSSAHKSQARSDIRPTRWSNMFTPFTRSNILSNIVLSNVLTNMFNRVKPTLYKPSWG